MSCVVGLVDSVLFVSWQVPDEGDIATIRREVTAAHAKVGNDLTFIGIIPEDTPPPSPRIRSLMTDSMEEMLLKCATMHVVVLGSGFKNSLLRSVASGILLVSGKRGRCFVHATLDEALRAALKRSRLDPGTVQRVARNRQLVPS